MGLSVNLPNSDVYLATILFYLCTIKIFRRSHGENNRQAVAQHSMYKNFEFFYSFIKILSQLYLIINLSRKFLANQSNFCNLSLSMKYKMIIAMTATLSDQLCFLSVQYFKHYVQTVLINILPILLILSGISTSYCSTLFRRSYLSSISAGLKKAVTHWVKPRFTFVSEHSGFFPADLKCFLF